MFESYSERCANFIVGLKLMALHLVFGIFEYWIDYARNEKFIHPVAIHVCYPLTVPVSSQSTTYHTLNQSRTTLVDWP